MASCSRSWSGPRATAISSSPASAGSPPPASSAGRRCRCGCSTSTTGRCRRSRSSKIYSAAISMRSKRRRASSSISPRGTVRRRSWPSGSRSTAPRWPTSSVCSTCRRPCMRSFARARSRWATPGHSCLWATKKSRLASPTGSPARAFPCGRSRRRCRRSFALMSSTSRSSRCRTTRTKETTAAPRRPRGASLAGRPRAARARSRPWKPSSGRRSA